MKETLLTPRQWAFVVITGGAVCALPFMQSSDQPERSVQEATLDGSASLTVALLESSPSDALTLQAHGLSVIHAGEVLPASSHSLPGWANANRSPFDELVGHRAAPPALTPPADQLPLQPLRPWISGPADAQANQMTLNATTPHASTEASNSAPDNPSPASVTDRKPFGTVSRFASVESSPWRDDPASANPAVEPVEHRAPMVSTERGAFGITQSVAINSGETWPDQKVSEEQLSKIIRAPQRELASATIALPQPASSGLTVPAAQVTGPPVLSRQTTTRPVTAHVRFGEPSREPSRAQTQSMSSHQNSYDSFPAHANSRAEPPPAMTPLPALPDSRKQHVIFQPPRRK